MRSTRPIRSIVTPGSPHPDAHVTLELIRERLAERAFLFEDDFAYRGGVEDALAEVTSELLEHPTDAS